MSRAARKAAPSVGPLFPGLGLVPVAPPVASAGRLTLEDLALVPATRPTLADRLLAEVAAERAAEAAATGCSAVACNAPRALRYLFCSAHQAALPRDLQTREARTRGDAAAHGEAVTLCVRVLAHGEGRTVDGERPPWADPPEVADRIRATLSAAGLVQGEPGKSWRLDVSRYGVSGRERPAQPTAWERVGATTRQKMAWLSADPSKTRMIRPTEIADPVLRARIIAAEKAGSGNGSHVSLGPILGAELDLEFRRWVAAACIRNGHPEWAAKVLGSGGGREEAPAAPERSDASRQLDEDAARCAQGTDPLEHRAQHQGRPDPYGRDCDPEREGETQPALLVLASDRLADERHGSEAGDQNEALERAAELLTAAIARGLARSGDEVSARRAEFMALAAELPTTGAEPDITTAHPAACGTRVGWHLELPRGVRVGTAPAREDAA